MKATELRIGNFLKEGKVKSIYYDGNIGLDTGFTHDAEIITSIPLTEEWLKQVDWKGYKYLYFNSNFCLDSVGHLYYHGDYTGINVGTVHQLQNLYFALTGEELELKE